MKSYHYTSCLNDDLAGMDRQLSSKKAEELINIGFREEQNRFP